jgi:hypothetical protein
MRGSHKLLRVYGSLAREYPEARPLIGKGHEGSVQPIRMLAMPGEYSVGYDNLTRGMTLTGNGLGIASYLA